MRRLDLGTPPLSMGDAARWRQGAYRLLATLFMPPTDDVIAAVPDAVRLLDAHGAWTASASFHGAWRRLALAAKDPGATAASGYRAQYAALFAGPTAIPLWETGYLAPGNGAAGVIMTDLGRSYAVERVRPGLSRREQTDHAAVELEFMSLLCGREADTWEMMDPDSAALVQGHQRRFLETHLTRWMPTLARLIDQRAAGVLHAAAAGMAWSLSVHDADLLRVLLGRAGPVGTGEFRGKGGEDRD